MTAPPLTPSKRLGLGRSRPSLTNTPGAAATAPATAAAASSPLPAQHPPQSSSTSPPEMLGRKTSYNQLTQNSLAQLNENYGGRDHSQAVRSGAGVELGDIVDAPGGLYGVVKFIGSVHGKAGSFVGVELEGDLAGRGKNDGSVEGVRYFTTAQPMSGIFVPLARTSKRLNTEMDPSTPTFPPSGLAAGRYNTDSTSPDRRTFSAAPKTPIKASIPRSESPMSRSQTPGGRGSLGLPNSTPRGGSAMGSRIGAVSPGPAGPKTSFMQRVRSGSTTNPDTTGSRPPTATGGPRIAQAPRTPYGASLKQPKASMGIRTGSSIGMRSSSSMSQRPDGEFAPDRGIDTSADTTHSLRQQLEEKQRQIDEQAQQLLEMEASLNELQDLVSPGLMSPHSDSFGDADTAQLRALLREKNEKIQTLTAEFDAHRADFRSTIDTLELASSETERVYESRVAALHAEIRELTARNEDVESVAHQLRQLEELVQELEEGLEDARRGEVEARGEAEFLRGELERTREELRREKEKTAAAAAAAAEQNNRNSQACAAPEELDKKDDEIRGLKAIIHSLSRDSITADDPPTQLQSEILALQSEISAKGQREAELEREIAELKKRRSERASSTSGSINDDKPWRRNRAPSKTFGSPSPSTAQVDRNASPTSTPSPEKQDTIDRELTPIGSENQDAYCEICEAHGHDILTCTSMFGAAAGGPASAGSKGENTAVEAASRRSESRSPELTRKMSNTSMADKKKSVHLPKFSSPYDEDEENEQMEEQHIKQEEPKKEVVKEEKQEEKKGEGKVGAVTPAQMMQGDGPLPGKESGKVEMEKWCAVCERDGHDSVDCPLDAF